ncbi:MAG: T9SS type A sorting domain-containing protein, partial [Saprospiraceae bacterium]
IKNLPSSSFISRNIFIEDLDKDGDDDIVQMLSDDGFLIFERIRISNTETINFEVNVYPNPADENLNVDADQVYGMKIIDASGKVMYSQPNIESQTVLVPVKDFRTGMYFIELITKDNNINRRPILIMH